MDGEMKNRIYRVPWPLIEDLWPLIREYAERACLYHPFIDGEDVLTLLLREQAQLFLVLDGDGVLGFAALEVVEYPRLRVANVVAAGGRVGFLPVLTGELLEEMELWSREQGATVFSAMGRAGWIRVANRIGGESLPISISWRGITDVRRREEADHNRNARPVGSSHPVSH